MTSYPSATGCVSVPRVFPGIGRRALTRLAGCAGLWLSFACAAGTAVDAQLPAYHAEQVASGHLDGMGDATMRPLMDAWMTAFLVRQPHMARGPHWDYSSDAKAFGALMFGLADIAPLAREPTPAELAPYAHQFAGDMMKSPLLVRVAMRDGQPAYLAVNKRPGAPLPQKTKEFLVFALSHEGQALVAAQRAFRPLSATDAASERAKLTGWLAKLDPALPVYRPQATVNGAIRSVGSDGMKTLMETWMHDFSRLQPGVHRGDRWEHLGTLNGFHALVVDETDLAPMGRELWPAEQAAWQATHPGQVLVEIRVARGGFDTPQRTTAQAVFVHQDNPLERITLAQLAAIMGQPQTITRWGQLGLGGAWKDRPITINMPPRAAPNAMSMQMMVLDGGAWATTAHEGSIAETARAIAADPGAIGFGGFEEGGPGLKTLALAAGDGGPYYAGTYDHAASGRYPLTRYMYIRLARVQGEALSAPVKEFLRYVLSRDGQGPIRYSGYFPLTADEVRRELLKLD